MAARRTSEANSSKTRRRPGTTPEAREKQLTSLAVDLAEEQLRNKTASAQVITHYLKMGSSREALEQERLRNENILLKVKKENMEAERRTEELYAEALIAMKRYQGQTPPEVDDDEDYD